MSTNLAIDDKLILDAKKIGAHKTKKEAVTIALKEYIRLHKQNQIESLFGKIDFDDTYNYKKARHR